MALLSSITNSRLDKSQHTRLLLQYLNERIIICIYNTTCSNALCQYQHEDDHQNVQTDSDFKDYEENNSYSAHNKSGFICFDKCDFECETHKELFHEDSAHNKSGFIFCDKCDFECEFDEEDALETHKELFHED